MRHSKSKVLTNSMLRAIPLAIVLCTSIAVAHAGRRVVVLDFDGPQADSFHSDVERVVKKSFVLIATSKWNKAAEANEIERLSEKNVKTLCKKVGVDGVVSGKIEKRRDEYIVRVKLRECSSGEMVGNPIDVKATGPRLDGGAMRQLREELTDAINALAIGGGGGGSSDDEEEQDTSKKKNFGGKAKGNDDEDEPAVDDEPAEEDKPKSKAEKAKEAKAKAEKEKAEKAEQAKAEKAEKAEQAKADKAEREAEAKRKADKAKGKEKDKDKDEKVSATDGNDDDSPLATPKRGSDDAEDEDKPKKTKRTSDDGDDEDDKTKSKKDDDVVEEEPEETDADEKFAALSPSQRAVNAKLGMLMSRRTLAFVSDGDLVKKPGGYKGNAASAYFDVDIYPLAIGHKRKGLLTNLGLTVAFEQALGLKSKVSYLDGGMQKASKATTVGQRFAVGAVFRYPFGNGDTAPMVTAKVRFGRKKFNISGSGLPIGAIDIPNVNYTIIEPSLGLNYPVSKELAISAASGLMLITNAGQIQNPDQYGPAKVLAVSADLGAEYRVTKSIFVHAGFQLATFGFKFKGGAMMSNMRDGDADQDVASARDTYLGGSVTAGFAY
jgi:hypothetical protein